MMEIEQEQFLEEVVRSLHHAIDTQEGLTKNPIREKMVELKEESTHEK